MTTIVAARRAKAEQATAERETAERALARAMRRLDRAYDPVLFPVAEAITFRRWEALLELNHPPASFAQAYSAFRRAQRLEMRSRSAAHRAKWAAVPAAPPAPARLRKKKAPPRKMTIAAYLAEARAA